MNTTIKTGLLNHPTRQSRLNTHRRDLLHILPRWLHRARSRKALSRLDQRLLEDIGLTQRAAQQEMRKSFWQK